MATVAPESEATVRLSAARGVGLLALYLAGQLAVGVLVGMGIALWYLATAPDPDDTTGVGKIITGYEGLIGLFAALIGGLAFISLVLVRYRGSRGAGFRNAIGLRRTRPRAIIGGAAAGFGVASLYLVVAALIGMPPPADIQIGPTTQLAVSPGLKQQMWTLFGLLGSPPIEEFVFRGVLLASFAASWGVVGATIVTTGLFVGMHYPEISAYWPATMGLTAMSLAATYLRLKTDSLWPAISAHLGYNFIMITVVHLAFRLRDAG